MLENFKSKEHERLTKVIAELEDEKSGIEEKYRKLADTETAAITAAIEAYSEMLKFWENMNDGVMIRPKRRRRTKSEIEASNAVELPNDEKVVDTIYPENNDESHIQQEVDDNDVQLKEEKTEAIKEIEQVPVDVEVFPEQAEDNDSAEDSETNFNDEDDDNVWPAWPEDLK